MSEAGIRSRGPGKGTDGFLVGLLAMLIAWAVIVGVLVAAWAVAGTLAALAGAA